MSNQGDDCYFFFYSTCTKGDSCGFRHCEAALGNETICSLWQEGRCFRQICKFRHMEIDKKRSEIPCYWENQISGCQKANCAFHHAKGRFVDGSYFPPNKTLVKLEPCEPDVQTSLPSPAPEKLSVAPTPQLRGVKKIEATENVPSPTHPPVVINAADDDEDDDDQFSEEGDEHAAQLSGSQHGTNLVSARKSLTPKKDLDLNYGIKTLEEIKSEKLKGQEEALYSSAAFPEKFHSSHNQIDNSVSVLRTVKFSSKDSTVNLSLAQRLGKRKKSQAASEGEVLLPVKKTLLERLGTRITPLTDNSKFQPKKVQTPRLLKDRLGLQPMQSIVNTETVADTGTGFRIKTLQEIRQEKASQRLEQDATSMPSGSEDKLSMKSKTSPKSQTVIHIKSLSEIQEEKRLRQLKEEAQKLENTKNEISSETNKDLEQKNAGNTASNDINPNETTPKQTVFNSKVQGEKKIKRPFVNDNISSVVGITKTHSVSLKEPKPILQSIEKVRVKTLEEIRQEKALRLQQNAKSENMMTASQPQAPSHHKKILRLSKLPGSTDSKLDHLAAKPHLPMTKAAEEENKISLTCVDTKNENNLLITGCQKSPLKGGSDGEVLKPTTLTLQKKGKPKLNVEPCMSKNTLSVKAAVKHKAQETTIVAEVKPMSSAATCSKEENPPETIPVVESSSEPSMDSLPPKRLKISSPANIPLPSASATVQPLLKSPRTSTASMGKISVPTEDDFDELMWEISDDKLEAELDLDSNKDEDALLLELSKMIDS
ncbi:zinc finger CCCH domain-containing protein 11A-like isoform 2-T3 [Leptodactylus fuscus]|uniref:zinc finger CCCH domain-containing protein 11A-like isoform X2 n=1 Tax=Leptodactylus fuscus TaxID=238119 RepID=UPI003F4EB151